MKEVTDIESTQIRLFAPGYIPYRAVSTRQGIERLQDAFGFREVGLAAGGIEIVFEAGLFKTEEQRHVPISRLQISDRRIVVAVASDTPTAGLFLEAVRQVVGSDDFDGRRTQVEPVCVRNETSCAVTLDVSWEEFLSPPLGRFVSQDLRGLLSDREAAVSVIGLNFRLSLGYSVKDERITQYGFTLAAKKLVIEPLANTPLAARRFFTSSPTDSETHLRIVEEIERVLRATR